MDHKQRVSGSPELKAQRITLISFLLVREERDGKAEVWVGKVLLLSRCLVKGKSARNKLAFVLYVQLVAPLDEVDMALKCVCLQCATSGSRAEREDIEREER